jgi:hypothetical protein
MRRLFCLNDLAQSPPPPSGPAKRARVEKAGGGVSDEKWCYPGPWRGGCVGVDSCERGWGGVAGRADGKQAARTGRTGKETAEGATEVRAGTKDERKTKGGRILAPNWRPGTRGP